MGLGGAAVGQGVQLWGRGVSYGAEGRVSDSAMGQESRGARRSAGPDSLWGRGSPWVATSTPPPPTLPSSLPHSGSPMASGPVLRRADDTGAEDPGRGSPLSPSRPTALPHGVARPTALPHGVSLARARLTVAVLCYVNLLNYMDRFTVASTCGAGGRGAAVGQPHISPHLPVWGGGFFFFPPGVLPEVEDFFGIGDGSSGLLQTGAA